MGHHYGPGDAMPASLVARRDKLRSFWESQWIEHAPDASEPGEAPDAPAQPAPAPEPEPDVSRETSPPEPPTATLRRNGSWYYLTLPDGTEHKANGQKAYDALVAQLGVQVA